MLVREAFDSPPVDSSAEARAAMERHLNAVEGRSETVKRRRSGVDTDKERARTTVLARLVVPNRLRFRARLAATRLAMARERRRAQHLVQQKPLFLHLGSQKVRKEGWVNVDLAGYPVDLRWNVLRPLPFPTGSVRAIFHEHLLEHFTLGDAISLAEDWHRVLEPGGILRIGVPDAELYVRSYVEDGSFLREIRPEAPTRMLAIGTLFYWPHHLTMYDSETLELVLLAAGFESVKRGKFGVSAISSCPDSVHRRVETLYVEAVK